jgi:hypothetical protein
VLDVENLRNSLAHVQDIVTQDWTEIAGEHARPDAAGVPAGRRLPRTTRSSWR